ncbi:fused MFS/spermidine synthase [Paenibacillus sp. M1]|uniref:Fused MFS/spermidine synthase n=1 Tax=Paenibacillus haidiansis TaxID=1574488 RepID=A0ABU7VS58_9BACL
MRILYEDRDENWGKLIVYEVSHFDGEYGSYRVLAFSEGAAQGVMDLGCPDRIVFEYPRAILHLMETYIPDYNDVYVIGLGIGTLPARLRDKRVKVAEVDPRVREISRRYFGYSSSNVDVGDGRDLLEREPDHAYDFLILDAFTEKDTPQHLLSEQFFRLCKDKLHERGGLIMNLFGRGPSDPIIRAVRTTLRAVFSYTSCFELPQTEAAAPRNILIMGACQPIRFREKGMAGFVPIVPEEGYLIRDRNEKFRL